MSGDPMGPSMIHTEGGREYHTGCLPRVCELGDGAFPVFSDDWLIPRSKWSDYYNFSLEALHYHTINQDRQNSCCGCMTVQSAMLVREYMGLDRIVMSQASVYALGNGNRDQGMSIDKGWEILQETGCCPTSLINQYDWEGYRESSWPDNWKQVAANYRAFEVMDAPTIDHLVSGLFHGWIPCYGSDGHAVILFRYDGKTDPLVLGSWGSDYGDNGIHRWPISQMESYGGWLLRVMTDPPDDGDLPEPQF